MSADPQDKSKTDPGNATASDEQTASKPGSRFGWGSRLQDLKIGDAVGGWVKKVGEMVEEFSDQDRLNNQAKEAWLPIAQAWAEERFAAVADAMLGDASPDLPAPLREQAILLAATHAKLVADPDAQALAAAASEHDGQADPPKAAHRLWRARRYLEAQDSARARDELRRAQSGAKDLTRVLRLPFARLHALLSAESWAAQGQVDKAARAIDDARALPDAGEGRLGQRVDLVAIELWLALDRLDEADALSAELYADESARGAGVVAMRARVCATRGQLDAARALRAEVGESIEPRDAARLGLVLDEPAVAVQLATAWLKAAPQDPERLRVWALSRILGEAANELGPADRRALIDAMQFGLAEGEGRALEQRARELAFVALALGHFDLPRLDEGDREATLLALLGALQKAEGSSAAQASLDAQGRPRLPPPPVGAPGPDEISPLRDVDLYERTIASRGAFAAGLAARQRKDPAAAHAFFVEALVEEPSFAAAREALAAHTPYPSDGRLESVLSAMTERLGAMPQQVLGLEVEGLASTLEASISARERLARPLTIAIMGEFSAGKSTFVNAWLGRALAPMGALPTTCTINVFRRGGQGHARVHRRDGEVQHVDKAQVPDYLAGLDEGAAAQIRHVEIERGEAGFGEATVVDTPGLNALDPYHEQVAREFLSEADAIVWIFSATRGAAESERAMLEELRGDGRRVLGILNKADVLEPSEQSELIAYLRERLGEVLVDVVPLCATDALARRIDPKPGDDPLAQIEASLEEHFLGKARALKSEVVRRRVLKAIASGRKGVAAAADRLDARAGDMSTPDAQALRVRLQGVGDALTRLFGETSDTLMRELLSMGVVEIGEGLVEDRPTTRDLDYLGRRLARELGDAVRAVGQASAGSDDARLHELVNERAIPWLDGYIAAWTAGEGLDALVRDAGKGAKQGESSVREALRRDLQAIGTRLTEVLRGLDRRAAASYAAQARRRGGRPRAEALRLRVLVDGELAQASAALEASADPKQS